MHAIGRVCDVAISVFSTREGADLQMVSECPYNEGRRAFLVGKYSLIEVRAF